MSNNYFEFKKFKVFQNMCAMKVGTDGTLLGAWACGGNTILDIGTGTGLIALIMAQRFPSASVTAVEIDKSACIQASQNFSSSPFSSRIRIVESSVQNFSKQFDECTDNQKFDAIVCNPPYFVDSLNCPDMQRNMARHATTLDYTELFCCVSCLLSEQGTFSVVLPAETLSMFDCAGRMEGFCCIRKYAVKTVPRKSVRRYLLSYSKNRTQDYEEREVCLCDAHGNKTEWYDSLTSELYLR